ncbi:transposase [Streptomyces sp. MMS24-I2-30]|uniref:transposase n=1 Tax=Streptomyces sp. MMS24-I2-30 TaxID=3351564 RepID=UPI00389694DF
MQVSRTPGAVSAAFNDRNLIACAGLLPVMRLAERCGLSTLVTEKVKLPGGKNGAGAAPGAKVTSIVGGMAAGAESMDDLNVLRHGATAKMFAGLRAPSTPGTFLRTFTHGHALQLHAVQRRFLTNLATHTPLLPDADALAFTDVDSTHKRVYGRAKQAAEYGRFKGIRTLHPLLAMISTPTARPVIAAVRMRRGEAADSRGAPKLVSEALATAREAGCTGLRLLRAGSKFRSADVVATCRRTDARFSITTGMNPFIKRAIGSIPDTAWQMITYPSAVEDPDTGPGPHRPFRTPHHRAPTRQLALAARLDAPLRHHPRPTPSSVSPPFTRPPGPNRSTISGNAGQTGRPRTPRHEHPTKTGPRNHRKIIPEGHRWIEAKRFRPGADAYDAVGGDEPARCRQAARHHHRHGEGTAPLARHRRADAARTRRGDRYGGERGSPRYFAAGVSARLQGTL